MENKNKAVGYLMSYTVQKEYKEKHKPKKN